MPEPTVGPLDPKCSEEGLIVCDRERIEGQQGVSLDELIANWTKIAKDVDKEGVGTMFAALDKFAALAEEARPLLEKVNALMTDIEPMLQDVREGDLLKNVEQLTKVASDAASDLRQLNSSILTKENTELLRQSVSTLTKTLKHVEGISADISSLTGLTINAQQTQLPPVSTQVSSQQSHRHLRPLPLNPSQKRALSQLRVRAPRAAKIILNRLKSRPSPATTLAQQSHEIASSLQSAASRALSWVQSDPSFDSSARPSAQPSGQASAQPASGLSILSRFLSAMRPADLSAGASSRRVLRRHPIGSGHRPGGHHGLSGGHHGLSGGHHGLKGGHHGPYGGHHGTKGGHHGKAKWERMQKHAAKDGLKLGSTKSTNDFSGSLSGDFGSGTGSGSNSGSDVSSSFSVTQFGADGGGSSDDSKAFAAAFEAACKEAKSSDKKTGVVVPSGKTFMVKPVLFEGPCGPGVQFTIDGTIVGPSDPGQYDNPGSGTYGILNFRSIPGLEIVGGGLVDGNAEEWWKKGGDERPQNIVIVECHGVLVTGITSKDSAFKHLFFYENNGVTVRGVTTLSPEESPNTDSLHLSYVKDALIENCEFSGGDDNVAIINGTSRVLIQNIVGNSGHGISIGSLGKDKDISCVSDITVRKSILRNTANGLRIKTWQGGKGSARGIHFEDMILENVGNPIRIDQFYCNSESSRSCGTAESAVAIADVTFKNVKGTTSKGEGIKLDCSDTVPCSNILLSDINIQPVEGGEPLQPFLNSAYVTIEGSVVPQLKDVKSPSSGLLSAVKEMEGYC
ncbi:unnamed protein product [Closterium sp. Naga37s-1]|nr:unnamed protein product [Closterium sp. Naga37s-1]